MIREMLHGCRRIKKSLLQIDALFIRALFIIDIATEATAEYKDAQICNTILIVILRRLVYIIARSTSFSLLFNK